MTTYKDLIEQRKALDEKIAEARRAESSGALATIRQLVEEFGTDQRMCGGHGLALEVVLDGAQDCADLALHIGASGAEDEVD